MEMQLDILSVIPIPSAGGPVVPQVWVLIGGFLLLAIPVIVLRVRPFAIAMERRKLGHFGPYIYLALLVVCGGLSGVLFSYELVRSYAFSRLWYCALPAGSAASVYFQYAGCRCPGMIRALSDNDWMVRSAAAEALGSLGDKRAVDPLIKALTDDNWMVRRNAAWALGRLGDARAVDPLIAALADDYWRVRENAAGALGQLDDQRAVDPLITASADTRHYEVRDAADEALKKLGYKK